KDEKEGRVGDIGPAVLTGTGDQEQRDRMLWRVGCLGLVAVVALAVWLLRWTSPERAALNAYTEPVATARNSYPNRLPAIQERAWLARAPPSIDMDPPPIPA